MPFDENGIKTQPGLSELPFEPAPQYRPTPLQDDNALADCRGKRIGILIVTYNAVTTLLPVLKRITPNVWRNVEEVVVFDDASADATFELAVGLKALRDLPKLQVIKHEKNLGYGGNQKAGYRYMISRGFDIVVLLHGDGQYAPEILAHLYAPIVRGESDAVFGTRMTNVYGGPLKGGMPLYKYVGNRILTWLENRALGLRLSEFHSGYRAYSLSALKYIEMEQMTNDFHFDTEIIIKLHHQGFRISEVPIPTYYGEEICYVNGMRYAKDVARALYRYRSTINSVRSYSEFSEYWVQYSLKTSLYSSHYYVNRYVSAPMTVLDIGCGHGFVAKGLADAGCSVTGIDAIPNPMCAGSLKAYHRCDLFSGISSIADNMKPEEFDRIMLLDVLEHLPDSAEILRESRPLLKKDGCVVVSVPNVANITVRLMLLFGGWSYSDRGILDRTHLRFFTRRTARALVEENGYEVIDEKMTIMPLELVLGLRPRSRIMEFISNILRVFTSLLPGLLGYQIILLARRDASGMSATNR